MAHEGEASDLQAQIHPQPGTSEDERLFPAHLWWVFPSAALPSAKTDIWSPTSLLSTCPSSCARASRSVQYGSERTVCLALLIPGPTGTSQTRGAEQP